MKWLIGVLLAAVILEGLALVSLHLRMDRAERLVSEELAGDRLAAPVMAAPSDSRVREFDDRLTQLEDLVTDALVELPQLRQAASDEHEPSGRVAVPPAAIDRSKVPPPTDWASVMDQDLARVLIERGLTPYDPAVGEHVKHAGDAWRQADDGYKAELRALLDAQERNTITPDALRAQLKENDREWKNARKSIVDELVKALDGGS